MNRPDRGWGEFGKPTSWEKLARLSDFRPAGRFADQHGAGFWLERVPAAG
jgi:hypothetical protein